MWMGVDGCGWPSSSSMILASLGLRKRAPSSASAAADAATNRKMVHKIAMALLSLMGCPSLGMLPKKKYLDALLFESFELRYGAFKWTFKIMLEA